jgi:hypothetical protein
MEISEWNHQIELMSERCILYFIATVHFGSKIHSRARGMFLNALKIGLFLVTYI